MKPRIVASTDAKLRTLLLTLLTLLISPSAVTSEAAASLNPPEPLLVFAAASLTEVLRQIGVDYTLAQGRAVRFSFAGSSMLARQIEAGARADVFLSADQEWMDYLDARALIERRSRVALLGNSLVLIAPVDRPVKLRIAAGFRLRQALGSSGRLAVADPANVPAGKYARAALSSLGVWNDLADRLVSAENVRTALLYVARGEAPLGIVYLTDARMEPKVRIVGEFPHSSHPPIVYPAALTSTAAGGAVEFLRYLQSEPAKARFRAAGFQVLAH